MEAAWEGCALAKLAVNSLIGLLSIDETKSYKLRSSRHERDALAGAVKQIFHYGESGESLYDFITAKSLVSNASARPFHDIALCSEATRVGQMLYSIRQSKAVPYELKLTPVSSARRSGERWICAPSATATSTSSETDAILRRICDAWTSAAR
jgi:hypothetical protein